MQCKLLVTKIIIIWKSIDDKPLSENISNLILLELELFYALGSLYVTLFQIRNEQRCHFSTVHCE